MQQDPPRRYWSLADLFSAIALFMPIFATTAAVKHSRGGFFAYLCAVPVGKLLGGLILVAEWMLGKAIWSRAETLSEWRRDATGLALFVLQMLWILVGLLSGDKLGSFVAAHFRR